MKAYDDAIENLNKSLETAEMRNLESLLSDIYLKLSEVYDEKSDKEIQKKNNYLGLIQKKMKLKI